MATKGPRIEKLTHLGRHGGYEAGEKSADEFKPPPRWMIAVPKPVTPPEQD
jgi:hypothetical protein